MIDDINKAIREKIEKKYAAQIEQMANVLSKLNEKRKTHAEEIDTLRQTLQEDRARIGQIKTFIA